MQMRTSRPPTTLSLLGSDERVQVNALLNLRPKGIAGSNRIISWRIAGDLIGELEFREEGSDVLL